MSDGDAAPASRVELAALAARHGLVGLAPGELDRLALMAERVAAQVSSIVRSSRKDDEPAHLFRVDAPDAPTGQDPRSKAPP